MAEPWIDCLLEKLCQIFDLPPPADDNKAVNAVMNGDMLAKLNTSQQREQFTADLSDLVTSKLTLASPVETVENSLPLENGLTDNGEDVSSASRQSGKSPQTVPQSTSAG